jgi:hypothetical protein
MMTERMNRMSGVPEGAQAEWLGAMQSLAEQIQKQQQNSQQMIQELMNTYMQLLNTPGSYLSGQAEQQQQTLQQTAQQWIEQAQQQQQSFQQQAQQQQQSFQQMTQEVLGSYSQLFNIPLSYAKEDLRDAQFLIEGYDELTVEEVSARLGALSSEELREVRDYEERNKNRETILEQLDRRIRHGSPAMKQEPRYRAYEMDNLDEEQHEELVKGLREWVYTHPTPDLPTLAVMGRDYTPREIVDEVEHRTELGGELSDFLVGRAEKYGVSPIQFIERVIEVQRQTA